MRRQVRREPDAGLAHVGKCVVKGRAQDAGPGVHLAPACTPDSNAGAPAGSAFGAAPPGSNAALDGRPLAITPDGHFVFGFYWDQTKAALISVRYPDGGGDSRSFTPTRRQFEIQRVNGLPQNTVTARA